MTTNRGYRAGKRKASELAPPPPSMARRETSEERYARQNRSKPHAPRVPPIPPVRLERRNVLGEPIDRNGLTATQRRVRRAIATLLWWVGWIIGIGGGLFVAFALGQSWNGRS